MYLLRLFRAIFPFLVLAGIARAQLTVNSPEPITKSFLVQIVDTAANDGSSPAPLFGTPSEQAAIFSDVDQIWAQAGIEVNFEFLSGTWNNSFALLGNPGSNNPRPAGDLSTLIGAADQTLQLDPKANQLFMLQIVPSFSQAGSNTADGYSFTNFNGMSMWIGSNLPTSISGQAVAADVLAHEIGRNLDLSTDYTTGDQNLMDPDPTAGQLLTPSQIATVRESQFVTDVPEPSMTGFLVAAFFLALGQTIRRNRKALRPPRDL